MTHILVQIGEAQEKLARLTKKAERLEKKIDKKFKKTQRLYTQYFDLGSTPEEQEQKETIDRELDIANAQYTALREKESKLRDKRTNVRRDLHKLRMKAIMQGYRKKDFGDE